MALSTAHVIAVLGIVVSAVVALLIAAQNRKQSRQIELHKLDPSVGLIPPESVVTRLVKSHWLNFVAYAVPLGNIAIEFSRSTPTTRWSIVVICLSFAAITINVCLSAVGRVLKTYAEAIRGLVDVQKDHVARTKEMADALVRLHEDHVLVTQKMSGALAQVTGVLGAAVTAESDNRNDGV